MRNDTTSPIYLRTYLMLLLILLLMIPPYRIYAQEEHPHEPPRPQPTPPAVPSDRSNNVELEQGGWIELYSTGFDPRLWTGVQWQDGSGNWHDVTNWKGAFNQAGIVAWFVEQKDFNKGPFRWVVYQEQGGILLTTSPSFYLPVSANQVVRSDVQLPNSAPSYQPTLPVPMIPAQPYAQPIDPWSGYNQYNPPAWYGNDRWSSQCSFCHTQ